MDRFIKRNKGPVGLDLSVCAINTTENLKQHRVLADHVCRQREKKSFVANKAKVSSPRVILEDDLFSLFVLYEECYLVGEFDCIGLHACLLIVLGC